MPGPIMHPRPSPFKCGAGSYCHQTLELASSVRGTKKRPGSPTAPRKRVRTDGAPETSLRTVNVKSGATVHQRCLIITGECKAFEDGEDDYISVEVKDAMGNQRGPQYWPIADGVWKALILLGSDSNKLTIQHRHAGEIADDVALDINHTALTQPPPLYLAILVPKDSSALVGNPTSQDVVPSSEPSSLDIAIAKLRMTAYMWQAAVAEDMHVQGLQRRSFRLEEEWGFDTTRQASFCSADRGVKDSVARVHIIRSEKTLSELKSGCTTGDESSSGEHNGFRGVFVSALRAYGGPFTEGSQPVVAGMLLDDNYDIDLNKMSRHTPPVDSEESTSIQLASFGSRLASTWPRFLEEVPSCLNDQSSIDDSVPTIPGSPVAARHSHVGTCASTQSHCLASIGRTMGVNSYTHPPNPLLLYPSLFLVTTPDPPPETTTTVPLRLQSSLQLRRAPHLRLPDDRRALTDPNASSADIDAKFVEVVDSDAGDSSQEPDYDSDSDDEPKAKDEPLYQLTLHCSAAFARIELRRAPDQVVQVVGFVEGWQPDSVFEYSFLFPSSALENAKESLTMHVLGYNGVVRVLDLHKMWVDLRA